MTNPLSPRGGAQRYLKSHRLLTTAEYRRVFNAGLKVVCPELVMLLLPHSQQSSRFGVVASRKVGNAVVRNRIKRRAREIYRQLPERLDGDLVVIARVAARHSCYKNLALAFDQCYKRLRKKIKAQQAESVVLASESVE